MGKSNHVVKNSFISKVKFEEVGLRRKGMQTRQIKLVHDGIQYSWTGVSEEKYRNWINMTNGVPNTEDYTSVAFPFMLQIEPTSLCNLSCTLCPTGRRELNRSYRHMKSTEFRPIIDDMERYLLFLVLWDWGEPLMNPELPSMIRYASERGIKTVTSTNAHFLQNEAYVEELLSSGLTTLIVAVDSVSADNYKIYRKSGDLDAVLGGLRKAAAIKKRTGSETLINVRMVIMKQNEHEISAIEQMARNEGADVFTVKSLNPSCGIVAKDEELLPVNPQYRRYKYIPGTFERVRTDAICQRVWMMSNIFSNGDVVPCCYDYDSEMKIGNVFETPFTKLWNGTAYRALRRRIYNDMNSIPKCNHCGINFMLSECGWFVKVSDLRPGSGQAVPVDTTVHEAENSVRHTDYPRDMNISFSIIMPTYNRKGCIKNAVDSLLAQTYQDFELIVVDDGSTDGTGKYLKDIYEKEMAVGKIRFFELNQNNGAAFARNKGLKEACNNWIGYLDTDNLMHKDFLEMFAGSIRNSSSRQVFYAQIELRRSQDVIGRAFSFEELVLFNYIDLGVFIHSAGIYRELGGFDVSLNRLIDWDLIIKYTEKYQPTFVEKILLDYDDDPASTRISNNVSDNDAYKQVILNYFMRIPAPDFVHVYKYSLNIQQLKRDIAERDNLVNMLNNEIARLEAVTMQQQEIISHREAVLSMIESSGSWKLTQPLRFITQLLRNGNLLFRLFR
jgi:radical SAM protein with 4Fe4S-binding SPASM domain